MPRPSARNAAAVTLAAIAAFAAASAGAAPPVCEVPSGNAVSAPKSAPAWRPMRPMPVSSTRKYGVGSGRASPFACFFEATARAASRRESA